VPARQVDAEAITDDLCIHDVERLLSATERGAFAETVTAAAVSPG
jgi:hypothetical protein